MVIAFPDKHLIKIHILNQFYNNGIQQVFECMAKENNSVISEK